jgi:hypothetical protein
MAVDRRKFVHWVGMGLFFSILSGAIVGCTSTTDKDTESAIRSQQK